MNISLQIGRSVFALGLLAVAGAGAFAQSASDADAQAPNVAHNRLEILSSPAAAETPRWVVASVRVGAPEQSAAEQAAAAAAERTRVAAVHGLHLMPAPRS
jgi:hypothetical protein